MIKLPDNIAEAIKLLRQIKGLTQTELADLTGVKQATIAGYESGRAEPKSEFRKRLKKELAVDLDNLESITNVIPREIGPKEKHQQTRNHLKEVGNSKNGIHVYETAPTYAGLNTVYHDEHHVPDYVLNIPQFRDCNYGTRASGDSMYPEIRNGDLLVCKELPVDARIIYGDMYVIHTKDGIETIKYVQQFVENDKSEPWVLLVPHNKAAGMGTPIPRKEIVKLFKVRAVFKGY